MKQTNNSMLDDMKQQIKDEEESDHTMRKQYGEKWIRVESSKINAPFKF